MGFIPIKQSLKPYIFISIAGLFLLLEMGLQVSVSVITPQLMNDLSLTAAGVGFISSFFFYSYTFMQIPSGFLFDSISSKKIISVGLLLCAFGTLFFALTESSFVASFGRLLIGFGSAFSWVAVLYIASQWFDSKHFALIAGLGMIIASLGAMGGQLPLSLLVHAVGWRSALIILSVIGFILAVAAFLIIEDKAAKPRLKKESLVILKNDLLILLRSKQTWMIAIFAFAIWSPITAFASLWGVPFIQTAYNTNINTAAFACSLIWIGVAIGSPLLGWWSEKINSRIIPCIVGSAVGVLSSIFIIYFPSSVPLLCLLLILFGIAAGGQSVSFAMIKDSTSDNLIGTGIGFINMAVVASGLIFQAIIGLILKISKSRVQSHNLHVSHKTFYTVSDYHLALIVIPLIFLVSLIVCIFFIKETYKKQQ